jgi:energy coupling factor transporter S component ThiW
VFRGERRLKVSTVIGCAYKSRDFVVFLFSDFKSRFYEQPERGQKMQRKETVLRMIVLAFLIALGVVISPILRVEGMCPMAHFINITCAVLMGPLDAFLCALLIGIIRMMFLGIPPLALTGAIFGATLSGILFKVSKGKLWAAVIGEIIGTGIIGAIISYPIMALFWGRTGLTWLFYVPSFIAGTLIGGSIAYGFLIAIRKTGVLANMQRKLGSKIITEPENTSTNSSPVHQ